MAEVLSFDRATRIVARALGVTSKELLDSLRPAGPEDLDDVLALRSTLIGQVGGSVDRDYLRWRYALNPGNRAYAKFRILRLEGKPIAGIGAEEFQLRTPLGPIPSACAMDILTIEGYRSAGLGAWLNLSLFRDYPITLALGSNENSRGLVRKLYFPMQSRSELQFPLDVREYFRKKVPARMVASISGLVVTALLRLRSKWYEVRRADTGSRLIEIERFHEGMRLGDARASANGQVSVLRNPDYLNWRYLENPRVKYRALGFLDGPRLGAYVVYSTDADTNDVPALRIADWGVTDSVSIEPFHALIAAVVRHAVDTKCHLIRVYGSGSANMRQLRAAGFVREMPGEMAAGWHCSEDLAKSFRPDNDSWSLTGLGDDIDPRPFHHN